MSLDRITIAPLAANTYPAHVDGLAVLLLACVQAGASIGFVDPFGLTDSAAFWTGKVGPAVVAGTRHVFIAKDGERIVGTVQLDTATMPNQRHRGDVMKLMVHPDYRRRGIAKALMAALEAKARTAQRSLLTLDTRTGDDAEPLYLSLGYQIVGVIPDYAMDVDGAKLDPTTVMYKRL